jgi:hypothetical protein
MSLAQADWPINSYYSYNLAFYLRAMNKKISIYSGRCKKNQGASILSFTNSYVKNEVAMLGATFTDKQSQIRISMCRGGRAPFRTRSLTKVSPNATVQSTDTFVLEDRNQSMESTVVLRSKCRAHSSHLHFPPQHVERIRQRL